MLSSDGIRTVLVDVMAVQWGILKKKLFGIEEIAAMKCFSAQNLKAMKLKVIANFLLFGEIT